jgi:hypothetical protein
MFKYVVERLTSNITPALCKEDQQLWNALGLPFHGCHCLIDSSDALVRDAQFDRSLIKPVVRQVVSSDLVQIRA